VASRYWRVRLSFGLAGLAVLVPGIVQLGAFPAGLVVVAVLGGLPLLSYVFAIRSLAGSVFTGLAMLVVTIGTTLYVIGEQASSTAVLGYWTVPVVGFPLVVVTALQERAIRSLSGAVVAGVVVLAATLGLMLVLTHESAAESFCDHANGLGNTMIEVGPGPLTMSGAERLVAFHRDFVRDSQALREDGLAESAHVADLWADALAAIRNAGSSADRTAADNHLRRVVRDRYGSTGTCPNLR
jgi:hypothetical protein